MKSIRLFLFLSLSFNCCHFIFSQNKTQQKKANELQIIIESKFDNHEYLKALPYCKAKYMLDSSSFRACYDLGFCLLNLQQDSSLHYLKKANELETFKTFNDFFYLAKSFHFNNDFKSALKYYQKADSLASKPKRLNEEEKINYKLLKLNQIHAKNGEKNFKSHFQNEIIHLDSTINSIYPDYGCVLNIEETIICFTSERPISNSNTDPSFHRYFENVYFSILTNDSWENANTIFHNSANTEQALAFYSDKDSSVTFFQNQITTTNQPNVHFYKTKMENQTWSSPTEIKYSFINPNYFYRGFQYSESDSNLYFSSNIPGGFGGFDLYSCKKLGENQWGKPVNLGKQINTESNEEFPFLKNGILYFCSNGIKSIGGYDIFKTPFSQNTTINIEPMIKINTAHDEFMPFLSQTNKLYFSSQRIDSKGYEDIYYIYIK